MTYDILVTDNDLEVLQEAYSRPDESAWHLADSVWMANIEMTTEQAEQWAKPYAFQYRIQRLKTHLAQGRRRLPLLVPVGEVTR